MKKYPIQSETTFHINKGWYGFRDLDGDGFGQYMFKVHQHYPDMPKSNCRWINPVPTTPYSSIPEYFKTKKECLEAIAGAA